MQSAPLLAVFVGGQSRRMGEPKGLLAVPSTGQPIVQVLVQLGIDAGLEPVLVGDAAPYAHLVTNVARLEDDPRGGGPLAGLRAAVGHALREGCAHVLCVACDMPFVSEEALAQLRDHASEAAVLAPRRGPRAPWEPMLARYHAPKLSSLLDREISRGTRSFQALFAEADVEPLPLTPAVQSALKDWDTPEDLPR